ncbi:hypothetical protein EYF80_040406 [Liparis tanakae]|uniref:Uncharacterized protein n=1 Tax=Liparis tanakae TaxID=230148 RepID=A0A4Z2G999_9TELE|nr:hypothetical protein EYF80_040406 [Liparis tanakae]
MAVEVMTYVELSAELLVLGGDPLSHHGLLEALVGHGALHRQDPGHLVLHLGVGVIVSLGRGPRLLRLDPVERRHFARLRRVLNAF